jgi:hypothetical protein
MRSKTFQVWGTISWWIAHSYLCPRKFLSDRPCRGKHLAHCSQWNPIPAASKQVPLDTISLWVSPGTWQTKKPTRTEKQMMKVNIQHSRHSHGIHRGSLWHHLAALWGLKDLTTPVRDGSRHWNNGHPEPKTCKWFGGLIKAQLKWTGSTSTVITFVD